MPYRLKKSMPDNSWMKTISPKNVLKNIAVAAGPGKDDKAFTKPSLMKTILDYKNRKR